MSKQTNFRRLLNECKKITESAEDDKSMFILVKVGDNMFHWKATIFGPKDSLYEGYQFEVDIVLPNDYPTSAPQIKFITPIKHFNVHDTSGNICMDILKNKWSPALNMQKILISLISLLNDPNPEDPLNGNLADVYRKNVKAYEKIVRDSCEKYAKKI